MTISTTVRDTLIKWVEYVGIVATIFAAGWLLWCVCEKAEANSREFELRKQEALAQQVAERVVKALGERK